MKSVIILGASGRLGRPTLQRFVAAGFDVIAVGRTRPKFLIRGHWITADLTNEHDRHRLVTTARVLTVASSRVWVVDCVLDRSGVEAMRRSIQGATRTVVQLSRSLADSGRPCVLVAASTTAIVAPKLLQTPYGMAKQRQAISYARLGVPGLGLLLPLLTAPAEEDRSGCSFDDAAQRMVEAAGALRADLGFVCHVPALPSRQIELGMMRPWLLRLAAAVRLNSRDSMQAHRTVSRSRLSLASRRIRVRIDHHVAPPQLLRRFAGRHRIPVTDGRASAPARANNGSGRG
ncbi:hypothetical protein ACQP2E_37865 [Actinoplanes sp. CA-015351]|uniref:hypothetical protein n=1 Tax=Actinoplanes sp. CA-015351 TaxID=3239897 RepID=UPI003D95C9D6